MKSRGAKISLFRIIQDAFERLSGHSFFGPKLQNKWLSAKMLVDAMKEADYFSTEHACMIDVKHFNTAMSKSRKWGTAMLCFDGTNVTNIWRITYDGVHFYMFSEPCQQVQYPAKLDNAWCQEVYRNEIGILRWTRSATEAGLLTEAVDGFLEQQPDSLGDCLEAANPEAIIVAAATTTSPRPSIIYLESTDARNLFGAYSEDENAQQTLQRKIAKLKAGNQTAEGYRMIVEGRDPHDACTQHQIYEMRQRCALLCTAYIFARDQMNNGTTWESCCRQACLHLNMCGIEQITGWQVLERWNIAFRAKECFDHPNPYVGLGFVPEPLLFEAFPSIKRHIRNFCLHDLANLTIEKVRDYVLSEAIPKCMQKDNVDDNERKVFLQKYSLEIVSHSTNK